MTSGGWHQFPRGGVGHSHASRARETREGSARFKRRKIQNKYGGTRLFSVYETFVLFCKKFAHQRVFDVFNSHCACRRQKQKIKKAILGDIRVASHRNEKFNRYEISRQQKKRELK